MIQAAANRIYCAREDFHHMVIRVVSHTTCYARVAQVPWPRYLMLTAHCETRRRLYFMKTVLSMGMRQFELSTPGLSKL